MDRKGKKGDQRYSLQKKIRTEGREETVSRPSASLMINSGKSSLEGLSPDGA